MAEPAQPVGPLRIDVVTIFPDYLAPLQLALIGRAQVRGLVEITVHDLRTWTQDVHRTADDAPYGGGAGMVMRPEPWWAALGELLGDAGAGAVPAGPVPAGPVPAGAVPAGAVPAGTRVVVPTPSGRRLDHALAAELAGADRLIVCCGRYEGIDQRVLDHWATDEVSLGDYVLSGGEAAALVLLEAVIRLLPGVVGRAESVADDSFATGLLEGPVYTRPESIAGYDVPPVLLSGDHAAIARWRHEQALERTRERRPDLLG